MSTDSQDVSGTVCLREATDSDLELLMAWRSNPLVYRHFTIQDQPLVWEEHVRWWLGRRNRKDWIIVLRGEHRDRSVGTVSASRLNEPIPEVGLLVGETTVWGKGVGRAALAQVLGYLSSTGYSRCWAGIQESNARSRAMFQKSGFQEVGHASPGRLRYERDIATRAQTARPNAV